MANGEAYPLAMPVPAIGGEAVVTPEAEDVGLDRSARAAASFRPRPVVFIGPKRSVNLSPWILSRLGEEGQMRGFFLRRSCLLGLWFVLSGILAPLSAQEVTEPSTGTKFPARRPFRDEVGQPTVQCVGTAVRKRLIVKVYGMCLYVDLEGLRQRAAGRKLSADDAGRLLVEGDVPRGFVLQFVRDVGRDNIVEAFREGLRKNWPGGGFSESAPAVQQFLSAVGYDIARGQEIRIWLDPEGGVTVQFAQRPAVRVADAPLARAVAGIWLGAQPVSPDLRASLLKDLPSLLAGP